MTCFYSEQCFKEWQNNQFEQPRALPLMGQIGVNGIDHTTGTFAQKLLSRGSHWGLMALSRLDEVDWDWHWHQKQVMVTYFVPEPHGL
uniref:Cytoplasmic protein n=1 Tax=Panagrellus redivivus TaxID=6233 RepID=A0A7E4UYX7_PANRE